MFVIVYNPNTNDVYYQRRMGPNEKMIERKFADQIAAEFDATIADSDGYIPNCCGDLRVEFRRSLKDECCIWSGESFYLETE